MPDRLPIYEIESELVTVLRRSNRLVIQAPTGSGKSTQVPQMVCDRILPGRGRVVVLQPRRLATRLLATRVARERGVPLGEEVGYQIRLENRTGAATRIQFETEGVLLRQMLTDPLLPEVGAIIFDEFHERHLYGDVTLAQALALQKAVRPDLKLIVMSATLELEPLLRYLDPCEMLVASGRQYPVEIDYLSRPVDLKDSGAWEVAGEAFERLVAEGCPGDVLIFMPGAYEISRTLDALRGTRASKGYLLLPLHGELSTQDQDAAVANYDRPKVVVATNVAETSLTIEGIRAVIDSGLARIARHDPRRGINTLLIEKISQASADQRAGRAGRTAPGRCLRLWTEAEHRTRPLQEQPEIHRVDLAEIVLSLKAAGVPNVRSFPWLEAPKEHALERAEMLLRDLGAEELQGGAITGLGRRMVAFPVHPRYARMFLAAQELGCVRTVALIAALSQGRSILVRSTDKRTDEARDDLLGETAHSDYARLIRAWQFARQSHFALDACRRIGVHAASARQVDALFQQFLRIAEAEGLSAGNQAPPDAAVQKCILAGFSDQVARRLDTGSLRCELVHGRRGELARGSVVRDSPLLVASEIQEIEGRNREVNVLLTLATAIEEEWLRQMYPDDFEEEPAVAYDAATRRVTGFLRRSFRGLTLEQKRLEEVPREAAADLLAAEVMAGRAVLKHWDHAVEQWLLRVQYARRNHPELDLPEMNADSRRGLIRNVCLGCTAYKELKDKDVWPVVRRWLPGWAHEFIDKYAPERIELPGGRRAKVTYQEEGPPVVAARIEDLYEVKDRILLEGKHPVLIHVLAPNQRPVQVTQDLRTFWKETYPKVKSELQRKYPKHEWR